jgi:uncharacterized protein
MKKNTIILCILSIWLTPSFSQQRKVSYIIKNKCEPIAYGAQKIYGFLGDRLNLNMEKGLAKVPYYSYMRAYTPGVEGYWPAGEYLGKFSQALINSYKYSNNQYYYELAQKIIDTWVNAQQPDGYVASNPNGYIKGARWNDWAVWDLKYTLLGLLDFYAVSNEQRVLESARKIGDLMIESFGPRKNQLDLMETKSQGLMGGSILEPMTYLYQYTGESKYLDYCNYILKAFEQNNGPKIVSELTERSGQVGKVGNGKGYEMVSCIIGIFRMYELTGNKIYLLTAQKAWQDIAENNSYITGTSTQGELFYSNKHLPADETDELADHHWGWNYNMMGEGCATAHWMFLSRLLYQLTGDLKYIEEIEKSTYNHLLGSQSAKTGQQSYYTALIGHKQFMNFNMAEGMPPCCLSSVQRCISTLPETIWSKFTDNGFAILMYNSGEFSENITAKDSSQVLVNLKLDADILNSGTAKITMNFKEPLKGDFDFMEAATLKANMKVRDAVSFRMALRVPSWGRNFKVQLKDGTILTGLPGEYLNIDRTWANNESITISMNIVDKVIEGSPTYKGFYAFKHGPYILAIDQSLNPNIDIDKVKISNASEKKLTKVNDVLPKDWIGNQAFTIESADSKKLILTPFLDAGQDGEKYRVWLNGDK